MDVPQEQRPVFEEALNACLTEVGHNGRPNFSREQAETLFDAMLEAADCVRGLGYSVAEPPSREAAIEALMQPVIELGGWDPYSDPASASGSQEELNKVYEQCPNPWNQV